MFNFFKRRRERKEFERQQKQKACEWTVVESVLTKQELQYTMFGIPTIKENVRLRTVLERNGLTPPQYHIYHIWDVPKQSRYSFEHYFHSIRDIESSVEEQLIDKYPGAAGCHIRRSYEKASDLNFN